jgi:hypothetical protein
VTSLGYRLHKVGLVLGGAVFYPIPFAKEGLRFFRDWADQIPDELVIQCGSLTMPGSGPVFAIVGCYHGDLAEGEEILKPLRSFGKPSGDMFGVLSYVQMQSLFDPFFPPGRLTYVKSNFMHSLTDQAIEMTAAYMGRGRRPLVLPPESNIGMAQRHEPE